MRTQSKVILVVLFILLILSLSTLPAVKAEIAATVIENFDGWSDGSYGTTSTYDHTGVGQWESYNSVTRSEEARSGNAVRFNDDSGENEYLLFKGLDGNGKDGGVGTISFWYRHWDGDASNVQFQVQYKQGVGAWTNVSSVVTVPNDTTYYQFSETVNIAGDDILVQVISIDDAERLLLDDFEITDYSGGGDSPPTVTSTTPTNGAANVAIDADLTIQFSEDVTVTNPWFAISCSSSGAHTAAESGGAQTFTLNPDTNFNNNETCTVTIDKDQVTDQDGTPDNMAADYVFSFTTTAGVSLIHTIQGSGSTSGMVGSAVTIEGIVIGDFQDTSNQLSGFYVQEEDADADANAATSEGVFVYDNGCCGDVSVGDKVQVSGTVVEHTSSSDGNTSDLTEITSVTAVTLVSAGNPLPTAAAITLPVSDAADWEACEGMLVSFSQTLYVTEHYQLGRYGQVTLSSGDRLYQPTLVTDPGAPALAQQAANDKNRIVLDDGSTTQNPDPITHPEPGGLSAANTLRGGDTTTGLSGALDHRFGFYRVQPVGPIAWAFANARPASPTSVGGTIKVASFNVLNYFSTIDTGSHCGPLSNQGCRGADSASEFTRQRDKIIDAIVDINADIIGLVELENHASDNALDDLVSGLNASAGVGTYAKVGTGTIGDDAIKVACIYKPAAISLVGSYAILDDNFDPNYHDDKNRPALAQTFQESATGEAFTVVVNHFKSKGSDCDSLGDPDAGDGQGNCNGTRTGAANVMVNWLATDPTTSNDPDFLIIGDLNAYAKEDPIAALETGGFTNLIERFGGVNAYSFVFDGQWGYLDYALANDSLAAFVTGVTEWHINSDEPRALDYNEEYKSAGQLVSLYSADQYRASDHDPLVVGLGFTRSQVYAAPTFSECSSNTPCFTGSSAVQLALDNLDDGGTLTLLGSHSAGSSLASGNSGSQDVIVESASSGSLDWTGGADALFDIGSGDVTLKGLTLTCTASCGSSIALDQTGGTLLAYANNITGFETGYNGGGGTANLRHNWWGSGATAGSVGGSDAFDFRLGAHVDAWADTGTLADSGNGQNAAISPASGTGTGVIVSHGRGTGNAPFGATDGSAAPCSDFYDFFVLNDSGSSTWDVTLPVDGDAGCIANTAGGTAATNKLFLFPLTGGGAPDTSCTGGGCWGLYGGTITRNGGNAPFSLTAEAVLVENLLGTPITVGDAVGNDPTAITLTTLTGESAHNAPLTLLAGAAALLLAVSGLLVLRRRKITAN